MRISQLLVLLVLGSAACTPLSPVKAKDNGQCKTNADCESGYCAQNKCLSQVDCNQAANASNPLCQNLSCKVAADCPGGYYCDGAICVFGDKPACKSDADCEDQRCLEQDGEDNRCVDCRNSEDCAAGETCDENECKKNDTEEGCKDNADCPADMDPAANKICKKTTGACVECINRADCAPGQNCRQDKCQDPPQMQDCLTLGCAAPETPFCDPGTKACVACDSAEAIAAMFVCPGADEKCDDVAMSPTKGQCIPDQVIQPGECADNSECTTGLPVGASADATFWCDLGGPGVPSDCKPCRLNTPSDCGNTFTCTAQPGGQNVCEPNQAMGCASPANCPGPTEACVNGKCQTTCSASNQCKAGLICNPTSNVCEQPASCTNNASCTTNNQYNGLTCKGAPKTCQECASSAECATSPGGATICDVTLKRCVAPAPVSNDLGAVCASNADCTSGLCMDFGIGAPVCTSICARTATLSTVNAPANDCPRTPVASLTVAGSRTPLPPLKANQGFTCVTGWSGSSVDGIGFCLHAVDDVAAFGTTGVSGVTGAYQTAAGAVQSNANLCQFGFTFNGGTQCAGGCGTSSDCTSSSGLGAGYTCNEVLFNAAGSFVSNGLKACFQRSSNARAPGEFCSAASDCSENFCAGTCVAERVPRVPARLCGPNNASPCAGTDICVGSTATAQGTCYRSTKKTALTADNTCADDSDCAGADLCWNGKCYGPEAVTNRLCQDKNSCADPALQICAGRCAKHCNEQTDCEPDFDLGATVCAYLPAAPGYSQTGNPTFSDGFVGQSWSRVCAGHVPAPAGATFDHELEAGDFCFDDTECVTEVCVNNRCSDVCGRAGACPQGQVCTLFARNVLPGDSSSTELLMPVCVTP